MILSCELYVSLYTFVCIRQSFMILINTIVLISTYPSRFNKTRHTLFSRFHKVTLILLYSFPAFFKSQPSTAPYSRILTKVFLTWRRIKAFLFFGVQINHFSSQNIFAIIFALKNLNFMDNQPYAGMGVNFSYHV